MPTLDDTSPVDLGLPKKFSTWRRSQLEGIDTILYEDQHNIALCQPTGSGKSILAPALHKITDARVTVLTATKGMQEQYLDDFRNSGMVEIKGRNNYACKDSPPGRKWTCEVGAEEGCTHLGMPSCPFSKRVERFRERNLGVTNYQMYMHGHRQIGFLGPPPDYLVCDEAHEIVRQLETFLNIHLTWTDLIGLDEININSRGGNTFTKWRPWAEEAKKTVGQWRRSVDEKDKQERKRVEQLAEKLWWIAIMQDKEWVWQATKRGVEFQCVWPGRYAAQALFSRAGKVVLLSGTLRPYLLGLVGIAKKESLYREWPRVFPAVRHPFVHIDTLKMKYSTTDEEMEVMTARVDEIIGGRLDRKGIIHTKSYDRAQWIKDHSEYRDIMILNESYTTREKAREFREADAPRVLISPSYPTGWDFPYTQCEYQIIVKVPFDTTTSQVAKERKKTKPMFGLYTTMQELMQMTGRGMRAEDDRCENFILDNQVMWFMKLARGFAPYWFTCKTVLDVPPPPPKLSEK